MRLSKDRRITEYMEATNMLEIKGSSWQQRYDATAIYTLRCRIADKPGMLGRLTSAIGRADANLGDIKLIELEPDYKIRDIAVLLKSQDELKALLENVRSLDGVEVLAVTDEILETHSRGSIRTVSRAKLRTLTDLRMVYTPGVASVCQKIEKEPDAARRYTTICDSVAIVTNGTAVLGLGDIGVLAALPVMEGKASILAEFVNVSGVPILIEAKDCQTFVDTVIRIASGFGAIQLEDVAAPACFEIEEKLKQKLDMPIFHDDQHGTATIVLAAIINALAQTKKEAKSCSALVLGCGAAGIAVSKMLLEYGLGDIVVYDSKGPIYRGRTEHMNPYKHQLAQITNKNNENVPLAAGFTNKNIFIGLSRPNMVTKEMVSSMAPNPIVLPLANPVGEITKEEACEAGAAVTADGRDINNALAYPGIFRGALDAHAREINMKMKLAAANEIARLAPEEALLPDILDKSVHRQVADAVAGAWST